MDHENVAGVGDAAFIRRRSARVVLVLLALAVHWAIVVPTVADAGSRPTGTAGSSVAGRCTQYEPALAANAPAIGWDVTKMSSIMSRESRCNPAARSSTFDTGLLQINDINLDHLQRVLGQPVTAASLTDPTLNIRAAAALCTYWQARGRGCYWPWTLTGSAPPAATTPPASTAATVPAPVAPVPPAAPSTTTIAGRCTQYEAALQANGPAGGWNVEKMSRLMFTTSNCNAASRWTTSTGLLRISDVNATFLSTVLGTTVTPATLVDPVQNIRAAAALCTQWRRGGKSCYGPWGGTG